MEIKILGTRGEIKPSAPKHANHSGILIDGRLMFDVGEKKFLRPVRSRPAKGAATTARGRSASNGVREKPQVIFITHLHPDHAFFVRRPITPPSPSYLKRGNSDNIPPLKIRGGEEGLWKDLKIFAPEKNKLCPQMQVISKPIKIGAYKITPLPTIHSKYVKSQAYLIETGEKRILYTGDMIWIKKKFWKFLKNLDLVITEGSFMKSGGMIQRDKKSGLLWGHQGIPDLIKFFSRFTRRIIITHFGSWFYKSLTLPRDISCGKVRDKDMKTAEKEIKALGKNYGIEAVGGYDGMKIII